MIRRDLVFAIWLLILSVGTIKAQDKVIVNKDSVYSGAFQIVG